VNSGATPIAKNVRRSNEIWAQRSTADVSEDESTFPQFGINPREFPERQASAFESGLTHVRIRISKTVPSRVVLEFGDAISGISRVICTGPLKLLGRRACLGLVGRRRPHQAYLKVLIATNSDLYLAAHVGTLRPALSLLERECNLLFSELRSPIGRGFVVQFGRCWAMFTRFVASAGFVARGGQFGKCYCSTTRIVYETFRFDLDDAENNVMA
jgi:hypothetical protein